MTRFDDWTDVEVLEELDERGEGLNHWEVQFVESLTKQLRMGRSLTEAQRRKLVEITDEKVRG